MSVRASDSPGHRAPLSPWGPKVCAELGPLQGAMPENMGFSTEPRVYGPARKRWGAFSPSCLLRATIQGLRLSG